MHSRATDRRSASKCQGKWPDQTLDQAFGLPEVLVAVSTSRLSCKRVGKTRTLGFIWRISAQASGAAARLFPAGSPDWSDQLSPYSMPSSVHAQRCFPAPPRKSRAHSRPLVAEAGATKSINEAEESRLVANTTVTLRANAVIKTGSKRRASGAAPNA